MTLVSFFVYAYPPFVGMVVGAVYWGLRYLEARREVARLRGSLAMAAESLQKAVAHGEVLQKQFEDMAALADRNARLLFERDGVDFASCQRWAMRVAKGQVQDLPVNAPGGSA